MKLKRYDMHTHDDSRVICVEEDEGNWVKYEDVEALMEIIGESIRWIKKEAKK